MNPPNWLKAEDLAMANAKLAAVIIELMKLGMSEKDATQFFTSTWKAAKGMVDNVQQQLVMQTK